MNKNQELVQKIEELVKLLEGFKDSLVKPINEGKIFPSISYPGDRFLTAKSIEEAIINESNFFIRLGVNRSNESVGYPLDFYPHLLVYGDVDSGKSVLTRNLVEEVRNAGFETIISTGEVKAYDLLKNQNNITSVTSGERICETLCVAQKILKHLRKPGHSPLCWFICEHQKIASALRTQLGKRGEDYYQDVVKTILTTRGHKIHLFMLNTPPVHTTIAVNHFVNKFNAKIILGHPDAQTYTALGFPSEAKQLAKTLTNKDYGRGILFFKDEDFITELQTYTMYSPGDVRVATQTSEDLKYLNPQLYNTKCFLNDQTASLYRSFTWGKLSSQIPNMEDVLSIKPVYRN